MPFVSGTSAVVAGVPLWVKGLALTTLAFLAPIKAVFFASMFMVAFDTVTGVIAAKKSGQAITSAQLRRAVSKAIIYTAGLVVCHVAGVHLLDGATFFGIDPVKGLAGMIGSVELLSALENLNRISNNSLLRGLITKLGSANDPNAKKQSSGEG